MTVHPGEVTLTPSAEPRLVETGVLLSLHCEANMGSRSNISNFVSVSVLISPEQFISLREFSNGVFSSHVGKFGSCERLVCFCKT